MVIIEMYSLNYFHLAIILGSSTSASAVNVFTTVVPLIAVLVVAVAVLVLSAFMVKGKQ